MKNLLIVYPGGCGGNHMANLISTNTKFTQLFPSENYLNYLLLEYKKIQSQIIKGPGNAPILGKREVHGIKMHFSAHHHLSQLKNKEQFNKLVSNETINILLGHEHCYNEVECQDYGKQVSRLPDSFWLVMSYPKENTIAFNRIKLYQFSPRPERYTYPFFVDNNRSTDYAYADDKNSLLIETEKFVDISGSEYLRERLKSIDIELPEFADTLHKIWINKLKEVLSLYDMAPK